MCSKFQRLEAGDEKHVTEYYYMIDIDEDKCDIKYLAFGILWFAISVGLIFTSVHTYMRTDAFLNVTRITIPETKNATAFDGESNRTTSSLENSKLFDNGSWYMETNNATLFDNFSDCTASSWEYCKLFENGSWYIETKNLFYGKLFPYSYIIAKGELVSCKPLVNEDPDEIPPYSYYGGLFFSMGGLLTASLSVIFTRKEQKKLTYWNVLGLGFSTISLVLCAIWIFFWTEVKEFSRNAVGCIAVYEIFPVMMHSYLLATLGWMSVFAQKFFMVKEKIKSANITCHYFYDLFAQWAPFCLYFPIFCFINWLLSYLFPFNLVPACDENRLVTEKSILLTSVAPATTLTLFNIHGHIMLKYHGSRLQEFHLKENFLILSKLLYIMDCFTIFGIMAYSVEFLLQNGIFLSLIVVEGFMFLAFAFCYNCLKNRD